MKRFLTSIAALAFTLSALAQSESNSKLHFGLKAAPALAWIHTDNEDITSDGSKFGFIFGLITEFQFAENYSFATGIDVASRGGNLKQNIIYSDTSLLYKNSYSLKYIEIPLTLKLKTKEIGYLRYYLQAGVAPGWLLSARVNVDSTITAPGYNAPGKKENRDVQDDINTVNVSMILGGGIEYTLSGSTVLLVGIQFSNGFLDAYDGSALKANSNYLSLSLGVLF
jgi:opacity protein-like surface antigen